MEDGAKQVAAKKNHKHQWKQKQAAAGSNEEEDKKLPPKDRSNYKHWSCGEMGHLANSKQCSNHKKKSKEREVNANVTIVILSHILDWWFM